jgi:hypothetical protein
MQDLIVGLVEEYNKAAGIKALQFELYEWQNSQVNDTRGVFITPGNVVISKAFPRFCESALALGFKWHIMYSTETKKLMLHIYV